MPVSAAVVLERAQSAIIVDVSYLFCFTTTIRLNVFLTRSIWDISFCKLQSWLEYTFSSKKELKTKHVCVSFCNSVVGWECLKKSISAHSKRLEDTFFSLGFLFRVVKHLFNIYFANGQTLLAPYNWLFVAV